jgi:hypothetical protein
MFSSFSWKVVQLEIKQFYVFLANKMLKFLFCHNMEMTLFVFFWKISENVYFCIWQNWLILSVLFIFVEIFYFWTFDTFSWNFKKIKNSNIKIMNFWLTSKFLSKSESFKILKYDYYAVESFSINLIKCDLFSRLRAKNQYLIYS